MKFDSPLRYPGGKASLAGLLAQTIRLNDLTGCSYFEPFAGGAGAALRLLREEVVSELHLNDCDPRVFSFWRAVLDDSERFAEAVLSVQVNMTEWRNQQQICLLADSSRPFELGFATFYLNRCNRSGIIFGGAPIGGYGQTGKWRMDARFYKESLAERILAIGRRREQIYLTRLDALDFLVDSLGKKRGWRSVFAYLDPPYYSNGNRLYMDFYQDQDHRQLAGYIQEQDSLKWLMSYDDANFIRSLYAKCEISDLSLKYSLQRKRQAREILISPSHVLLPTTDKSIGRSEDKLERT